MRSEDYIPEDLRRLLQQPYAPYVLGCACLILAVLACFFGIRKVADSRLVPIGAPLTKSDRDKVEQVLVESRLTDYEFSHDHQLLAPAGKRDAYLLAYHQAVLNRGDPIAVERAAFKAGKLWEPREDRRRRWQLARQDAVAESLRAFAGIDDAYVHFTEATSGGIHPKREVKAIVSIRPGPGVVMDAKLLSSIRRTVAGHQAGLMESDVTIVNRLTGDVYDGTILVSDAAAQSREIQRATLERQWNESVTRVLNFIPGASVETYVELEPADTSYARGAPRPTRITVAVAVPARHYRRIWEQQRDSDEARTPTATELSDLEERTRSEVESLVKSLLPTSPDKPTPGLHVALFCRSDATDSSHAAVGSTVIDKLRQHSNKIVQITMVALAIGLVIFAFRDLFYEDVPDEEPRVKELRVFTAATDTETSDEPRATSRDDAAQLIPSKEQPGSSYIHADLTDLVREHPQAASAMLKSWVEKAS